MKNTKINILFVFAFLILCFVLILTWIDKISEHEIDKEYRQLIAQYTYDVKHDKISEIVSTVHTATQTALKNGYKLHQEKLIKKHSNISSILLKNEKEDWCNILKTFTEKEFLLEYTLLKDNQVLCQSKSFNIHTINHKLADGNIYSKKELSNNYILKLEYQKDKIHNFVKNRIAELIRDLKFKNPNIYVWVNEIKNYDGGNDYAIRRVHPNLIDTEDMLLSTHTQDAKGNFPYLDELNAIKKMVKLIMNTILKRKQVKRLSVSWHMENCLSHLIGL